MQAPRIEIDDREADGDRVEGIDPHPVLRPDVLRAAVAEAQPGEEEDEAIDDEPEEGARRRARRPHLERIEHAMQDQRPLVDPARGEELLGGRPLEVDPLGGRSAQRLLEVHLRGLGSPPRPLEQLGQAQAEAMSLRRRARQSLQREPVERDGAIERELRGGLLRRALGVEGRALPVPGADEVRRDRLRIRVG